MDLRVHPATVPQVVVLTCQKLGWVGGPKRAQGRNLGPKKIKKIKILKIKIRVAQNVGKVWIGRKKHPGPISGYFLHGPNKSKKKTSGPVWGNFRTICPWTKNEYISVSRVIRPSLKTTFPMQKQANRAHGAQILKKRSFRTRGAHVLRCGQNDAYSGTL